MGDGADWRHPHGPGSTYKEMPDHPVVHLSWQDANSYCDWKGTRLPTEAEFEYAARGGLEGARYAWGDELIPGGVHLVTLWQGTLPRQDRVLDGFGSLGPVKQFPSNGYGLCDMTGNLGEWVNDLELPGLLPPLAGGQSPRATLWGPESAARRQHALQPELLPGLPGRSADDDSPGPPVSGHQPAGPHHRQGPATLSERIVLLLRARCGVPLPASASGN
ncbi:MAG: SUMF1/EgtB/PvdO family nonheme iron enzyme [Bryobacterales bacterium]|nr:SUMF1/EgtB/PvdO family nonheme iron enzyme [Bryobacterales bacterium]